MRRRPFVHSIQGREGNPVSLFPFLAVLICTMGTLILLLVVLVRQVRLHVEQSPVSQQAEAGLPSPEELARLREDLAWQQDRIREARQATQEQLNAARALLGHSEESIRRLRAELETLQKQFQALRNPNAEANAEALRKRLQATEEEIAALERQLAERGNPAPRPVSYAVVPYLGKHGTARRPVYLECRGEAIVLQPEGIEFVLSDFLGPLGPGNPLDAALRAAREYLVRSGQVDPTQDGDTYPLLLVRPDGIEAFYAARAALTSWGTEFGYELIEADWTIAYPPPEPQLAAAVREAVRAARERREFLVRAAPGRYGRGSAKYRVSPYLGGAVREGDGGDDPAEFGPPGGGSAGFSTLTNPDDTSVAGGNPLGSSVDSVPTAAVPYPAVGSNFATMSDGAEPFQASAGPTNGGVGNPSVNPGKPAASPVPRQQSTVGDGGTIPDGSLQPGASPSSPTGRTAGPRSLGDELNVQPLATGRGVGWAVPGHDRGAIPVTRPIRIECYADRIVLVPEKGLDRPQVFTLEEGLESAVDRLIASLNEYMKSWGIAGNGMYWRPVLNVRTAPGAATVYRGLQILLQDSGLQIDPAEDGR
ncbi:MAG: hypothetical protein ACUVTW_06060 [Thermogutta sp.]